MVAKNKRNPIMKLLGGKRGIAVIAGTIIAGLASGGVINPLTAQILGGVVAVVGGVGIIHSNVRK
jgi:hypothetical protein